jgi:hypothetical protein
LSATKVLKAAAFHPDFLPSETVTNTYLIREHGSSLPVVSISTSPTYLWDNSIGIYTNGTNGIPGNCNDNPMNWNQDWSRHAVFEYLSASGNSLLSQSVDIRIGGACSRNFPQKSFVINPEMKFGSNVLEYNFFPGKKKLNEFGGLFLRNSGNDFNTTMFRDAFIQSIGVGEMDLDYMAYQPAVFYLNGEYWGIQNLREKIDGNYIESNYGIDKADVDLLETYENAIEGSAAAWQSYKNTLQTLNPTDPNTFDFIDENIDVQEYINYLVTEIYACNTDWPGNNVKFWRQRSTNGKFRWILWDTDFGFGLYSDRSYSTHPTLNFATDPNQTGWPNPAFSTLHIRLVLANPEFRNRFIGTFAAALGSTFNPDRVDRVIDEFASRIEAEVPYHKTRWGGNKDDWNYQVLILRSFALARNSFMKNHLAGFFGLGEPIQLTVKPSSAGAGKIEFNGVRTDGMDNATYYRGVPYRAKALPSAGFTFVDWTITTRESQYLSMAKTGDNWRYFDQGFSPGSDWTSNGFNDSGWLQGKSQLGYGDGDEASLVNYGPDSNNKFITTYFRKDFNISDLSNLTDISASVLFDDGVVVYLNGAEVYRNNLPAGTVNTNTLALSAIAENTPTSFTISKNLLKSGLNTFAVEVHQSSPTSSDISFDFNASAVRVGNSRTFNSSSNEVYDTAYSDVELIANYQPIPSVEGLVLNEFSTGKSFVQDNHGEAEDWLELYNAGTQSIDISRVMVTDDLTFKDKHVLSNGSPWIIQPGAYQILWADDQMEQGLDHLPFKLSNEGEELGLFHIAGLDTTVIASVRYGPQPAGYSVARIPNATGDFELTSVITPRLPNESGKASNDIYPNPADQSFKILVSSEPMTVSIYNSLGVLMKEYRLEPPQESEIDTYNMADGVYFVKISSPQKSSTARLIVVHE